VPPLEIYFDLRPMNLSISFWEWILFYAGFYGMQVVLAFYTLGSFRYETLMLAAVSFPIYGKALWNVLAGKEQAWHVTGAGRGRAPSPFNFVIPQTLVFVFLSLTSVVAVWRDSSDGQFTLATAWNVTNSLILGAFMVAALREQIATRRAERLAAAADSTAAPTAPAGPAAIAPAGRPLPALPGGFAPALRTSVVHPATIDADRDRILALAGVPSTGDGPEAPTTRRATRAAAAAAVAATASASSAATPDTTGTAPAPVPADLDESDVELFRTDVPS
jgi:cellulose synthase (UDP-forming)